MGKYSFKAITFLALKGGVGKTTLASHSIHFLRSLGFKVLIIDMDIQCSITATFAPTYYQDPNFDNLDETEYDADADDEDISPFAKSIHDAFSFCRPERNLYNLEPGLDLIPGSFNLIQARGTTESLTFEKMLKKLDKKIAPGTYDFVVIDTPGTWDNLVHNVVKASDILISPCTLGDSLSFFAMKAMKKAMINAEPDSYDRWHVIFNETAKNLKNDQYREYYRAIYPVMDAEIPRLAVLHELRENNKRLTASKAHERAYEAINAMVTEILGTLDVPIQNPLPVAIN